MGNENKLLMRADRTESRGLRFLVCAVPLLLLAASTVGMAADRCTEPAKSSIPVRLLIVTGGHLYEPTEFFAVFNAMPNIQYDHVFLMDAKVTAVPVGGLGQYDVVLFYDMEPGAISPGWRSLLDRGKGLFFLHHAVGSFTESPDYKSIMGAHGNFEDDKWPGVPNSTYHMNQAQHFSIVDHHHPVTCGMEDFDMIDEAYDNIDIDPAAHVLMKSDFPKLSTAVAWTWTYTNKRVLYLQMGHGSLELPLDHGPTAYQNASFKRFLARGILWSAGQL